MAASPVIPSTVWRPQPRFSHVASTADQLDQLNESGGLAVDFAGLPKSPVHIAFAGSQSETLSIWTTETRSGFRTSPTLAADLVTIRFVNSGAMSRKGQGGKDVVVGFNEALFTSFEEMRHEQAMPGFSAITATVSRQAVIAACQAISGRDAAVLPSFNAIVPLHTVGLVALRQTLVRLRHQLIDHGGPDDWMTPLLQEMLVYQLVSTWPTLGPSFEQKIGQSGERPVRLAIDYVEANLHRRMEIAEIAGAAGLSVRALQIAFKKRTGCSPVQYLISRRLDRVHAMLQTMEKAPIRQVASQWGFTHMSDFARRYRARFGHSPRELGRAS